MEEAGEVEMAEALTRWCKWVDHGSRLEIRKPGKTIFNTRLNTPHYQFPSA
jgi:hypothetical protein